MNKNKRWKLWCAPVIRREVWLFPREIKLKLMLCFFVIYNLSLLVITFPNFSFFCCVRFVMSFFFQFRHAIYLIRLINSSRRFPKWLPNMAAITHFVSQTVRFHSQCPEGSCQVICIFYWRKSYSLIQGYRTPSHLLPFFCYWRSKFVYFMQSTAKHE